MLKQTTAITGINLKSIPERWGPSLVIVIGLAGVVAVFTALLAMVTGFESTLKATGREDVALIMRGGSDAELNSGLPRDQATLIKQAPGIKKDDDGQPLASAEMMFIAEIAKKGDKTGSNVTVRGVEPKGVKLRSQLKLTEGRMFETGKRELIVGSGVAQQFDGAKVGQTLRFRGSDWNVVGIFSSGDANDSELWCDVEVAQTTFNRQGYSSMRAALDGPTGMQTLKDALSADPRLAVDVQSELDYYSSQTKQFRQQIGVLAGVVTAIMALGAIFAALNSMYAAVATRSREIATLRAIGFGGAPIVLSVMFESLVLALIGGALGAAIAYVLFNGFSVSTLGQNFTQVVFAFKVTPKLVMYGLLIAVAVGLLGGAFPAARPSGPFFQRSKIIGVSLVAIIALEVGTLGTVFAGIVPGVMGFVAALIVTGIVVALGLLLTRFLLRLRERGGLRAGWLKALTSVVLVVALVAIKVAMSIALASGGGGADATPATPPPGAQLQGPLNIVFVLLIYYVGLALYVIWKKSLAELEADPMLTSLRSA